MPVFAKELMGGLPESASESARASWDGARNMSCANFGVGHTGVRALDVDQMTWVAEVVAGNLYVQAHTSTVRMSGYEPQEWVGQKSNRRLAQVVHRSWTRS
jgi:hypothetical protein